MMNNNILIVDDDPSSIQILGRILSGIGQMRFATTGVEALRLARESPPDLMLLDAEMPGMSGLQAFEALKSDPKLVDMKVIFVTSHSDAEFEAAVFARGAADFIAKPVSAPLVLARVKNQLRVKAMADELRGIATVDVVTGVANRRRFDESLEREWRRARRPGDPIALLMIDVDHFTAFNGRYGYPAGDACLRSVAQALVGVSLRPADVVARYGGGEFALLLPLTPRAGAEHVAHRSLDAVKALGIAHAGSMTSRHVTVSIGVACYDDESECWEPPSADFRMANDQNARCAPRDLFRAAEKALYSAKIGGRAQAWLLDVATPQTRKLTRGTALSSLPAESEAA